MGLKRLRRTSIAPRGTPGRASPRADPTPPPLTALAEQASGQLLAIRPRLCAASGMSRTQVWLLAILAAMGIVAAAVWPASSALAAHAGVQLGFGLLIAMRMASLATGFVAPTTPPEAPQGAAAPIYTILAPLYREGRVAARLVRALDQLDWPRERRDIKLLVEADDAQTRLALADVALPEGFSIVLVPPIGPRTKPKALNVGLSLARGALVAVYDAEDRPHRAQLRAAYAAFKRGGPSLGCVQAPLAILDRRGHWIALQFALEYAIHFRLWLPLVRVLGWPVPLGGTSNHFRADALRACGGWDPFNMTEDADIGVRLSRDGWRVGMIGLATYEEAPGGLDAWVRQRARWIKGHIQTWAVHMREPRRLVREIGLWGAFGLQATLLAAIASAFLHGPLIILAFWTLITGTLHWLDFALLHAGYVSAGLCAGVALARERALHLRQTALTLATMPLYWPLQTIAALRAAWQLWRAPFRWDKTDHGAPAPQWRRFLARLRAPKSAQRCQSGRSQD
jgi:glycosyltransferase XagB